MSEPRKRSLTAKVLLASVLILVGSAVALLCLFIAAPARFVSPATAASRSRFVGTWAGEHGLNLQFRADGTARPRSDKRPRQVNYFEWEVSESDLQVFPDSRDRHLNRLINRYVTGGTASHYEIVEITPDRLVVRDREIGNRLEFIRINDAALEAAP
jgi:hypothetical protein